MKKFLSLFCLTIGITIGLHAQKTIKGYVTDASNGEALIGATILIKETGKGTATDIDGAYTMEISDADQTMIVSYTGYQTQEQSINGASKLDFLLKSGELLEEVLVIGYGSIEKSDKTGAIESIKPKDKDVLQYSNFQDFLQGRATGVQVLSSGSELLSPSSIRIRGANSLRGDNEPLFVVDGIIVNSSTEDVRDPLQGGNSFLSAQNGLSGINPQDIESIEILKDASATAIYGSRGANGVILITTKKGLLGKPQFSYKATTRIGQATRLYDVLAGDQFVDYINEYRNIQGYTPTYYKYEDGSVANFNTSAEFMESRSDSIPRLTPINWCEDILQNSTSQNHRFTVAGGSESSRYYIGAGYNQASGIIPGTKMRAGDFLLKYDHELNSRLTLSPRISASYTVNNASKGSENLGSTNASLMRQIVEAVPFLGDLENNLGLDAADVLDGPRAWLSDYNDDGTEVRALGSLTANYKINDIFSYRVLAGVDYRNKERKLWYGTSLFRGRLANGEAGVGTLNRVRYNIDNTLNFKASFKKRHKINGTVGFIFDETNVQQQGATSSNFSNFELKYNGIAFGQTFSPMQLFNSQESILSFLGRVNYSYKNKYLVTLSFREDGSSKFTNENKWSFFPSAAFAWKIIEEPFMKNSNFWSDAKLRIGYGRTGSQAIQPYQTLTRYSPTDNLLSNGSGGGVTAVLPQNLGNPNLKWETTDQLNLGFDFGFLKDRLTGNIDVYEKTTSDLLQVLKIGPSAGFDEIITNAGSLRNRGFEIGLNTHVLDGKFQWDVYGTFSMNRNQIQNLGVPEAQFGNELRKAIVGDLVSGGTIFKVPANIFIEGQPSALFWGYQTNGIIDNTEELTGAPSVQGVASQLGDVMYVDQNGDGNITDLDLTIIGNPNPDYTVGLGSDFRYKGFNVNFFVNSIQGNDIANGNLGRQGLPTGLPNNIKTEVYEGAWREGKTDATYPRLGYSTKGDFTDRMIEDGSFVRLSFVSLGYTIPSNLIKGINGANLFVTGHNLLLITKYSGFDPEVNSFSFDPTRQGIDWNAFPNEKSISFGFNLNF